MNQTPESLARFTKSHRGGALANQAAKGEAAARMRSMSCVSWSVACRCWLNLTLDGPTNRCNEGLALHRRFQVQVGFCSCRFNLGLNGFGLLWHFFHPLLHRLGLGNQALSDEQIIQRLAVRSVRRCFQQIRWSMCPPTALARANVGSA